MKEGLARERTIFRARSQYSRKIEQLANRSMSENIVPELCSPKVLDRFDEPDLVVDDEKNGVVLVQAVVLEAETC